MTRSTWWQRLKRTLKTINKRSLDLSELEKEQAVFYEHTRGEMWRKGKIEQKLNDRSYLIKDQNGAIFRRNRVHMSPTKVNIQICDQSPSRIIMKSPMMVQPSTNIMGADPQSEIHVDLPPPVPPEQPVEQPTSSAPITENTRPKRHIKEPGYLKDYVRYIKIIVKAVCFHKLVNRILVSSLVVSISCCCVFDSSQLLFTMS